MKTEVAIPCYNEEATVGKVVRDFRAALPQADVVVYDNNSTDRTAELGGEAGARVVRVNQQGKGYVVQTVFEVSQADIIVMVDGDDTYEANDVRSLIQPLVSQEADMTVGTRLHSDPNQFRRMHHIGNRALTWMLNRMFHTRYCDILSGYRAFSRRFIRNVPLISIGFEVETELMLQALENGVKVQEVPIHFRNRPPNSFSKLSSFKDGYRIMLMMVTLMRDHRPLYAFTVLGMVLSIAGLLIWTTGFLYSVQMPSLVVLRSIGALLIQLSVGLFLVGLILNTVNTRIRELSSLLGRGRQ